MANPTRTGPGGVPPSAADTKNLTDAINRLTESLGQNNSTMKDLAKKETALSKTMENLKEFSADVTDDLMQTDLALGLAVKGLTSAGKGIGNLLGFGKKKEGAAAAGAAGGDTPVGTEKMGADGYIYVFKGKQWVLKAGQKDKTTGKKLGNRIATKAVAAGLGGRGNKATPTTPSVTPMTGGGAATDATMGGDSGGGMGMNAGMNVGGMLGGLVGGLAGGAIAGVAMGISKIPAGFVTGMGYLTAGLGIFALGMAGIAKIITLFGGEESLKLVLTNLADGLSAFNNVEGLNLGAVGISLIPFSAGVAALSAVLTGNAILDFFGGGLDFTIIKGLAESLIPFSDVDGTNLKNVGQGLEPLAKGVKGLAAGGVLDAIGSFFTGTNNNDILTNLATALGAFQEINGENLKNTGEGILALAEGFGLLTGAGMLDSIGKYFTGAENTDILSKLAKSLHQFDNINGANLAQIGSGLVAMGNGMANMPANANLPAMPGGGGGDGTTKSASTTPMSPTGASVNVGGQPNKQGGVTADKTQLMQYFMSQGLSKNQAAALVGNFQLESGLNTAAKGDINMKGGASVGLAQWRESRLENLKKFAADNNMDINDPMTQAQFAMSELKGSHKNVLSSMQRAESSGAGVEQLSEIVTNKYEVPAIDKATGKRLHQAERNAYAAQFAAMDIPAVGDNLNMASTSVENAAAAPINVNVNAPQVGGGQQPKQSPPTPPAQPAQRPIRASVAGPSYRGFQVSDIRV